MNYSKLARPALVFVALAAFAACKSGSGTSTTTSTSPSPAASTAAARPAPANAMLPFTTAQVALGDSIYHARSCRNCHGPDAMGRANGPALITSKFLHVNGTYEDFVRIITQGVPVAAIKDPAHANAMPPRGGTRPAPMTDDEIRAVAAYVYKLNHA